MLEIKPSNKNWHTRGDDTTARIAAAAPYAHGKIVDPADTVKLLEAVLRPGDKVNIEGDRQTSWLRNCVKWIPPRFMTST